MHRFAVVAISVGLALTASRAYAVWTESRLTPGSTEGADQTFSITTRAVEGMTEFQVTVAPKPGKQISPFTSAELMAIEENHHVATVPVAPTRHGTKFTFRFRLSPAAVGESRFDVREQGWTISDGKPEMTLGGQAYWFWLKDFADRRQAASPRE